MQGVKILYDSFFKEILNPDTAPSRLEELLSLILQRHIRILHVLPNDSSRIAEENALLIMDIVVQLEDGSIANIEVQKIGYSFPGQRSACYLADLLLRQYKRAKNERKKKFSYRDIKSVYTIVFIEKKFRRDETAQAGLCPPFLSKVRYRTSYGASAGIRFHPT